MTNTSPACSSSSAPGGRPRASRIAWTVSGQSGQRRAMPVFGRGKSIMPASRSTADSGRLPQSALPKPQLMPSRIIAFSCVAGGVEQRRISSAVNSFGPCFGPVEAHRLLDGRLKPGPKRTGRSIRPARPRNLKTQRMHWMTLPEPVRPPLLRHLAVRRAAKSSGVEVGRPAALLPKRATQVASGQLVVLPGAGRQLARRRRALLGVEEAVGQVLDGHALGPRGACVRRAGRPSASRYFFRARRGRPTARSSASCRGSSCTSTPAGWGVSGKSGRAWSAWRVCRGRRDVECSADMATTSINRCWSLVRPIRSQRVGHFRSSQL